ncbi:MAG: hypothetical protein ACRCUE_10300 [Bosea sp. (in: a-proteobacteria)]
MGQVIPWPGPELRPGKPTHDFDGPRGRVLLFLGVRYERHDDEGGAPPVAPRVTRNERPSRRRKRG